MSETVPQPQSNVVIVSPTGDLELSHVSLEDTEILENPTGYHPTEEDDEISGSQLRYKSKKQLGKAKSFMKSLYATKKHRFRMTIALCLIGVVAIIATLTETLKAHEHASRQSSSDIGMSMMQPQGDAANKIDETGSHSVSTDPRNAQLSGSQAALLNGGSSTNGSFEVPPPGPPGSCRLDTKMDKNLLYLTCPYVSNANGGFAMDKSCLSGERCVYACEPPYVCTENGFSDTDCVPYCDPYSASTYNGGLQCQDGVIKKQFPDKPLCAMGLNTSFIKNYVPDVISSCQTVYPGNEAPMIGIEVELGQSKQLTSFPQWYWHSTHAHFYVSVQKKKRHEACQWNYDALSLNSGGVDWMPYVVGGGSLAGHTCSECGQHNLDFVESTPPNIVVVQVIALIALCVVVTLMVLVSVRYIRHSNENITRNGDESKEDQHPDNIESIGTPPKPRESSCSHCNNCSSRSSGSYGSSFTRSGSVTDTRASTTRVSSISRLQELFNRKVGGKKEEVKQGAEAQVGFQETFSIEELRVTPMRRPSQMEECEIQFVVEED